MPTALTSRHSVDARGRSRWLYAGPYSTSTRAETSLEQSLAEGDVTFGERPDVVRRGAHWWVEIDV